MLRKYALVVWMVRTQRMTPAEKGSNLHDGVARLGVPVFSASEDTHGIGCGCAPPITNSTEADGTGAGLGSGSGASSLWPLVTPPPASWAWLTQPVFHGCLRLRRLPDHLSQWPVARGIVRPKAVDGHRAHDWNGGARPGQSGQVHTLLPGPEHQPAPRPGELRPVPTTVSLLSLSEPAHSCRSAGGARKRSLAKIRF